MKTRTQSPVSDHVSESISAENMQAENRELREEVLHLKNRVAWFEQQMFGRKSEKRLLDNPQQQSLLGEPTETPVIDDVKIEITYQRGTAKKQRGDDCVTESGLRFSDDVPVEVIRVEPPECNRSFQDVLPAQDWPAYRVSFHFQESRSCLSNISAAHVSSGSKSSSNSKHPASPVPRFARHRMFPTPASASGSKPCRPIRRRYLRQPLAALSICNR
jgi:hypothetical protein